MKELNDLIIARMNAMTGSGAIEKMIDAQLQKSIQDVLQESLRSYSDFGKEVKAKLDASLSGAIERVSFPEYGKFVSDAVVGVVSDYFDAEVVSSIQAQIKDVLTPVPKSINRRDFLNNIGEFFAQYSSAVEFEDGYYISPKWETNGDDTAIYMTVEDEFKVFFYDHRREGKWYIGYIEDESGRHITADLGGATRAFGVIDYLYKLYCTGTTFPDIAGCYDCDDVISVR